MARPRQQTQIAKQFSDDLNKEIAKQFHVISEEIKDIALNAVSNVTNNTVVDTSKALSNWIVTLGKAHSGEEEAHFAGKIGSTKEQSKEEAIDSAKAELEGFVLGQKIFVTNDIKGDNYQNNADLENAKNIAEEVVLLEIDKIGVLLEK